MALSFSLSASSVELFSNARIKAYPTLSELQVANSPIFKKPGCDSCVRLYDVPPKGEAADPERSKQSSRCRARSAVRDIALCNDFRFFFTWTLSCDFINRYDSAEVGRKVQDFLKNASRRKGFAYVCVPEFHKDGAIHFHGLCNLGSVRIERALNPHTGCPLTTKRGQAIYNMLDWKYGFSTCIPLDENYEAACNYVVKYLSKGCEKILGKWYLSSRNLKKRPDISVIDYGMDYDAFISENPSIPVAPVYRDICIATLRLLPDDGGVV